MNTLDIFLIWLAGFLAALLLIKVSLKKLNDDEINQHNKIFTILFVSLLSWVFMLIIMYSFIKDKLNFSNWINW